MRRRPDPQDRRRLAKSTLRKKVRESEPGPPDTKTDHKAITTTTAIIMLLVQERHRHANKLEQNPGIAQVYMEN